MEILNKLYNGEDVSKAELIEIINCNDEEILQILYQMANEKKENIYGKKVYLRGLIELTNYCKNDCYYCGIRLSNKNVDRYRMTQNDILSCCENGYNLGFRTFVLQGGEDNYFTDDIICDTLKKIKILYPDCAITLSIGEKSEESYLKFKENGLDRYLLRHESANSEHYKKLHPKNMDFNNRRKCLQFLKSIGIQTGAGFMVGSPFQTSENLAEDLLFLKELKPEMVGIGPFIKHQDTPFRDYENGTVEQTVKMVALTRLILPNALIPSTTALGTIDPQGREKALLAGANVVMPNLSPIKNRKSYSLYDNKVCTGEETSESLAKLQKQIKKIGLMPDLSIGNYIKKLTTVGEDSISSRSC